MLGHPNMGKADGISDKKVMHWMTVSGKYKDGSGKTMYIVDNTNNCKLAFSAEDLKKFTYNTSMLQNDLIITLAKDPSQLRGLPEERRPWGYTLSQPISHGTESRTQHRAVRHTTRRR